MQKTTRTKSVASFVGEKQSARGYTIPIME